MELHIGPDILVSAVQKEFNDVFPFLRIDFFPKRAGSLARSGSFNIPIAAGKRISECQLVKTEGIVQIDPEMKVSDLVSQLNAIYHLSATISRRSGNTWLQTSMTENWTLQKQNEHGMETSPN